MSNYDPARRRKLPARYASIVMPLILSMLMTLVVSLIATAKSLGFAHPQLASNWMSSWVVSWVVAFPVLLMLLPIVRRMVAFVCHPH